MEEPKLKVSINLEQKEALLVKLARELKLTPSSFLAISPELRKSATIGVLAALSLYSSVNTENQNRMHMIQALAIDAGVLTPDDAKELFK